MEKPMYSKTHQEYINALVKITALIIKADQEVSKEEMEIVQKLLTDAFADETLKSYVRKCVIQAMIRKLDNAAVIEEFKPFISTKTDAIVVVHFLLSIIGADAKFQDDEVAVIKQISGGIGLSEELFQGINFVYFRSDNNLIKAKEALIEKTIEIPALENLFKELFDEYYQSEDLKFGLEINQWINKKMQALVE